MKTPNNTTSSFKILAHLKRMSSNQCFEAVPDENSVEVIENTSENASCSMLNPLPYSTPIANQYETISSADESEDDIDIQEDAAFFEDAREFIQKNGRILEKKREKKKELLKEQKKCQRKLKKINDTLKNIDRVIECAAQFAHIQVNREGTQL